MRRRPSLVPLTIAVIAAVGLLSWACDGGPFGAGGSDELAPIHVTAFAIGTPVSTLVIEVTAADIKNRLVFNLEVIEGVATGTIGVPSGEARTFDVTAYDDHHNVTHTGSETADVSPASNPPLKVKLKPVVGEVDVEVTFGDYGVVVTPSAVDFVALGATTELVVTVFDQYGEEVPDAEVLWATTRPTIASVSQLGLVTALAEGTATIVATYAGVAGISEVTVLDLGGQLPNGSQCALPAECASGFCEDGYCTETACTLCYVGFPSGVCTVVPIGEDPFDDCPGSYCDGFGACVVDADTDGFPFWEDCDDQDMFVNPNATEVCNGIDDNCDDQIDENMLYCIAGGAAPHTDGENSCLDGWLDMDPDPTNGCETAIMSPAAGDLVITEIMANPLGSDVDREYFEILNVTDHPIDLWGVEFGSESDPGFVIDQAITIPSGAYFVLAKYADPDVNGGFFADFAFGPGAMSLTNVGDMIAIRLGGALVDSVSYVGGLWPTGEGASMNLDSSCFDWLSNDAVDCWCPSVSTYGEGGSGTPGISNESCLP